MKIENCHVYGAGEAIVSSGLPMTTRYDPYDFAARARVADADFRAGIADTIDMKRACRLASMESSGGHDCFLCGIHVRMEITAPLFWWPEFQRYHFADIVSSTSTIHKLRKILDGIGDDIEEARRLFHPRTSAHVIGLFLAEVKRIENIEGLDDRCKTEYVKAILPCGWIQTTAVVTNYRQLKTMYVQRRNHVLNEWREFCRWMETLPMAKWITGAKKENQE